MEKQTTLRTNHEEEDIWFIRHGQSILNEASLLFRTKYNLPNEWQILKKNKQFLRQVKYNMNYIDGHLSQTGLQQCMQVRKFFNSITPDIVLVSPMERTLETSNILFSGRNIPIVAEPLLSQGFQSACDISQQVSIKILRYPKVNFDNVKKEGEFWFLKNESEENQKKYQNVLDSFTAMIPYRIKRNTILEFMRQTLTIEQPQNLRSRGWKIKQMLKKYKETYNKIVVVSHFNTIRYTVETKFNEDNKPITMTNLGNCQIVKVYLSQLLKYQ